MLGSALADLQTYTDNRLDPSLDEIRYLAGIVGDRPSQYAKSPVLWNAAFRRLNWDARFIPLDVKEQNLKGMVDALRETDRLLGFSVTVPYKVKILPLLDEVDPTAQRIGAVNTVVRTEEGRLIGTNTDGIGFLNTVQPLFPSLNGLKVLMIGAGGAARAVGFTLAQYLKEGHLAIANRSKEAAISLARDIDAITHHASAIGEEEIPSWSSSVDLIVNCSTKGQSGVRTLPNGYRTILEPYSSLGPASPALFREEQFSQDSEIYRWWFQNSLADIEKNHRVSVQTVLKMPQGVVAYDLIYSPLETAFLRHCRFVGCRSVNGKGMNLAQAADAFCDKVCRRILIQEGVAPRAAYDRVIEIMSEVW